MDIFDKIYTFLFPSVCRDFAELCNVHEQALHCYVFDAYICRPLLEDSQDRESFRQYDEHWDEIIQVVGDSFMGDWSSLSFFQKKFFLMHRQEILHLYFIQQRYQLVLEAVEALYQSYPLAVLDRCAALLHLNADIHHELPSYRLTALGIKDESRSRQYRLLPLISSLSKLTHTQRLLLIDIPVSELKSLNNHLQAECTICNLHDRYVSLVLNDDSRRRYISLFCKDNKIASTPFLKQEKIILSRIDEFDAYVRSQLLEHQRIDFLATAFYPFFSIYIASKFQKTGSEYLTPSERKELILNPDAIMDDVERWGSECLSLLSETMPAEVDIFKEYVRSLHNESLEGLSSPLHPSCDAQDSWELHCRQRIARLDERHMAVMYKLNKARLCSFVSQLRLSGSLQRKAGNANLQCELAEAVAAMCLSPQGWTSVRHLHTVSVELLEDVYEQITYLCSEFFWLPLSDEKMCGTAASSLSENNHAFDSMLNNGCTVLDSLLQGIQLFMHRVQQFFPSLRVLIFSTTRQKEKVLHSTAFDNLKQYLSSNGIHWEDYTSFSFTDIQSPLIVFSLTTDSQTIRFVQNSMFHQQGGKARPMVFVLSIFRSLNVKDINLFSKESKPLLCIQELLKRLSNFRPITANPQFDTEMCCGNWNATAAWEKIQGIPCFSLFNYYPAHDKERVTFQDWQVRTLIWDFKGNPRNDTSEEIVLNKNRQASDYLVPLFCRILHFCFSEDLSQLTLVCAPSSKRKVNEIRYRYFSEKLCTATGMSNAYAHISVLVDGDAKHTGGKAKALLHFDESYFTGRRVLLLDDVITKGATMHDLKLKLESLGAQVVGGCSIGRTRHSRQGNGWVECLLSIIRQESTD